MLSFKIRFGVLLAAGFSSLLAQAETATLPAVKLKPAFSNLTLSRPLWLEEAPDNSHRLFVAQQDGRVVILPSTRTGTDTNTFLDLTPRKPWQKNEEGLLGFAFHPQFKKNGLCYTYYSQQEPKRSVISEWKVSAKNPNAADPASERIILEIPQPEWNHNGGQISFGRDGYLYIALGDGGGARDPFHTGQNLDSLLAKILRIDVDKVTKERPYGIPKDNPFVGQVGVRPEIWAWGLRNVWRFSFDRQTGELYAGDVGQDKWEEIDVIQKGGNYGWSFREGLHEHGTNPPPAWTAALDPIVEYPHFAVQGTNHAPGLSVTGGYVYRGNKLPGLRGVYLYADFVSGTIWGLRRENAKVTVDGVLELQPPGLTPPRQIASFGEDAAGELYVLSYDGKIYELEEKK